MSKHYAEQLADYVVSQSFEKLPQKVVDHAKWCLLDSIGVAIAGSDKVWARAVLDEVLRQGGWGPYRAAPTRPEGQRGRSP